MLAADHESTRLPVPFSPLDALPPAASRQRENMAMKRLLSLATIVSLCLGGLFAMAEAQSQAGGLPDVSARVSILEGIATTLQNQVTTLQTEATGLRNQVTVLQTANTNLQNAFDAETAARVQGDNALRAAVDSERV